MSEAGLIAAFARKHWPASVAGAKTLEDVGRALVKAASCGPRHWAGLGILRSLGVLVDGEGNAGRPS